MTYYIFDPLLTSSIKSSVAVNRCKSTASSSISSVESAKFLHYRSFGVAVRQLGDIDRIIVQSYTRTPRLHIPSSTVCPLHTNLNRNEYAKEG